MKNLPIVLKEELNILQTSKKGTLVLDCNDFEKFGLEERPFNLSAVPIINGHTKKLIYEIKAAWKHSFSKGNISGGNIYFRIVDIDLIKKELDIDNADFAEMFNYKNANSFATSSAYKRILKGLVSFYKLIKESENIQP
jgi:hypothetical protein